MIELESYGSIQIFKSGGNLFISQFESDDENTTIIIPSWAVDIFMTAMRDVINGSNHEDCDK